MYQIRHTAAKGLGVFATRNIPRGTRILAEKPVILVKSERDVYNAFRSLHEQDRNELMQLSVSSQRRSNILGWAEGLWHASQQALSGGLVVVHGDGQTKTRLPDINSITEYPAVLNVFRNNNFDIGNGTQAIFKDISRLNHACIPNAQGNFNANLDRFTIHALRPISEDEEITLSYLAEHGASRSARQNRLQSNYGFPCDCPACDTTTERGKLDEEARQRMQSRLHSYAQSVSEQEGPDQITELEIMNHMIEMREEQGLAGRELATMCFSAAELAANIGRRDVALKLANKGLSLDEDAVGMDSPVFEESKARAQKLPVEVVQCGSDQLGPEYTLIISHALRRNLISEKRLESRTVLKPYLGTHLSTVCPPAAAAAFTKALLLTRLRACLLHDGDR
ncbi:hypothetical protein D0865_07420 [Hortaea werneckii]|uniref:SET domain-containing protein n=1 Tax=Hortaea werneckii TaxID=91943 RepID=A0A3M7CBT4_HORWE|nr:hypothetical protein D0865_07420 [Hortaea werneckii]